MGLGFKGLYKGLGFQGLGLKGFGVCLNPKYIEQWPARYGVGVKCIGPGAGLKGLGG